jgi:hypothetical protein
MSRLLSAFGRRRRKAGASSTPYNAALAYNAPVPYNG